MSLFYYDNFLHEYETDLNYTQSLRYLENLYEKCGTVDILVTIIGNAWLYFIEGDVNKSPKEYDHQLYLYTWKKFVDLGKEQFSRNEKFCFIAGYTLCLHGFYLGEDYEKEGLSLIKTCLEISKNLNLRIIVQSFYENETKRKQKAINYKNICEELFPYGSMLDMYFKEIYA